MFTHLNGRLTLFGKSEAKYLKGLFADDFVTEEWELDWSFYGYGPFSNWYLGDDDSSLAELRKYYKEPRNLSGAGVVAGDGYVRTTSDFDRSLLEKIAEFVPESPQWMASMDANIQAKERTMIIEADIMNRSSEVVYTGKESRIAPSENLGSWPGIHMTTDKRLIIMRTDYSVRSIFVRHKVFWRFTIADSCCSKL